MKNLIFFFTLMPFLAYSQTIYHVSALNAKVYDLPNTGSSVLETLKKGEEIQFLKTMESGSWAKVQSKGKIGYMEVSTIAEGSKVEKKVKAAARAKYHVSVFQSAIYKAPKFSAPKVETLSQNKIIEVIGEAGEWGTVRTSSGIGYVNMAHLTKGMPEKVKKTKSVSTKYYTLKLDAKLLDKPNGTGKTLENLSRGDGVNVVGFQGEWAKVQLDRGYGYVNKSKLEKEPAAAGGGSGGGSGIKMKDIGKTKNPKKVGAICRDGSSDYKVGPNTCAKGNGVKMWIYSAPK